MKRWIFAVLCLSALSFPNVAISETLEPGKTERIKVNMIKLLDGSNVTTGNVRFSIENMTGDTDDGEYWNGSAWAAGLQELTPTHIAEGDWEYSWAVPSGLFGRVRVRAWETTNDSAVVKEKVFWVGLVRDSCPLPFIVTADVTPSATTFSFTTDGTWTLPTDNNAFEGGLEPYIYMDRTGTGVPLQGGIIATYTNNTTYGTITMTTGFKSGDAPANTDTGCFVAK